MATKVKRLEGEDVYRQWLEQQGDRIKVVSVNTEKKRFTWTRGLFGAKTIYVVTYEEARPARS